MNTAKSPIDSLKVTYSIKCLEEDTPVALKALTR